MTEKPVAWLITAFSLTGGGRYDWVTHSTTWPLSNLPPDTYQICVVRVCEDEVGKRQWGEGIGGYPTGPIQTLKCIDVEPNTRNMLVIETRYEAVAEGVTYRDN